MCNCKYKKFDKKIEALYGFSLSHPLSNCQTTVVRKEIESTVRLCRKYGCPCDITLKDISTVSYRPRNLIVWAETASEVLDEYYGEA